MTHQLHPKSCGYFRLWRWFALDPQRLTPVERTLLRTALVAGILIFVRTYFDTLTSAGDDLRNRVVGARVMLAGYDPYTFFWHPDLPEELLDPVHDESAHRLTISPPTLLLYAPIAPLPYKAQRLVSFLAEWAALCASLLLLARSLPNQRQRVVFLCGALLFVVATDVWRLHLERGQIYVVYLLALSLAISCSRRGQKDSPGAGVALGVLALMRPNLLVILPALALSRQWRSAGAMLTTVVLGVATTCLVLPVSSWQSYLGVGEQYFHAIEDPEIKVFPRPVYTAPVEGIVFGNSLPNVDSSSFAVLCQTLYVRLNLHDSWELPPPDLALSSKLLLGGLAVFLLTLAWRRGRNGATAFALILILSLNTEFLLPHRWGYADVMLLAPLAMMLPEFARPDRTCQQALGLVMIGLCCGPLGQYFMGLYAATVLRSWLVMGGLTVLALALWWQRSQFPLGQSPPTSELSET